MIFLGVLKSPSHQQVRSSWGISLASCCFFQIFFWVNLFLSWSWSNQILLIGGLCREGFFFIFFVWVVCSFSSVGMEIFTGALCFPFLPALLLLGGCWSGASGSGCVFVRDIRLSKDYEQTWIRLTQERFHGEISLQTSRAIKIHSF